MKFRVGILGSYGGLNLGDEAILQVMIEQLRASLPVEITVFSRNADDTRRRHQVEHVIPFGKLGRDEVAPIVANLDLLILGGGGLLYDQDVEVYLREVSVAQEMGVPVMVYGISAGPLDNSESRMRVRTVLNQAAVVSVREPRARKLLADIGLRRKIRLTADPAFLLQPEPFTAEIRSLEDRQKGRRLVGISVREPGPAAPDLDREHYHSLLAAAADFIVDRMCADLVFVPMERRQFDVQHSHAVISRMTFAENASVLHGDYTPGQILDLVGRLDFAVGMRLHFLMFAAMQRVPFVPLPYAPKVEGLLEDLNLEALPVKQMTIGPLLSYIDRAWDLRARIKAKLDRRVPGLQERASLNNQLAVSLLREIETWKDRRPGGILRAR
ncbi:MAG: polysaccharide pyruvyl transferase family protein [Chloroflexota bacterium]